MRRSVLLLLGLLSFVAFSATTSATVPPKTCKTVSVKGKRYQIKADRVRCPTAVRYARSYLGSGTRPPGYRCQKYGSSTKLAFRCERRPRVIFAIRR